MSESIVILMISVSTFLGAIGLFALIWAVRAGQFDDEKKFTNALQYDSEDELNDAKKMETRKSEAKKKKEKNYRPVD